MNEKYLTLKQLIEKVEIPENSCKRYLQVHQQFLKYEKRHNQYRIHQSAIEPLKIIRRLYGEGLKKEAVHEYLVGAGIPVATDSEEVTELTLLKEELHKMMQVMRQRIDKMEQNSEEEKSNFNKMFNRKEVEKYFSETQNLEE